MEDEPKKTKKTLEEKIKAAEERKRDSLEKLKTRESRRKAREAKKRAQLERRRKSKDQKILQPTKDEDEEQSSKSKEKIILLDEMGIDKIGENLSQEISKRIRIPFLQRSLDAAGRALSERLKGLEVEIDNEDIKLKGMGDLELRLSSLNKFIQQIQHLVEQPWMKEIDEAVKTNDVMQVISAVRDASQAARNEQEFDQAIDLLETAQEQLLPELPEPPEPLKSPQLPEPPEVKEVLPQKDKLKLKLDILKDLQKNFENKGQLDKAIQNIEAQVELSKQLSDSKAYLDAQIQKGFLFMRRGDFSQAADIFRNTLNYAEELPSEEKKKYIPELKRSLAIVYRMQGEYNTALAWFSEAMAGFQTIQDELGIFKVLLGVARIHSLRGEWNKAANTYNQVIESYSYRKPDQWLLATYSELVDSLLAAGDYSKAKEMLDKVNDLLEEVDLVTEKDENIHLSFQIQFIRFYQNEKNFELALKEIQKVWDQFNALEEKEIDLELNILKTEIEILLDLDRCDDARKKLEALFPNLKSDWMKATYWQLMGILEQREMNLGSAKSALEKAIVKSKEIGHYQLLVRSRILYATLLVDQAKLGSQSAFQKADDYLKEIETEMKDQQMTPRVLDCQILRATLASLQKDYDSAYQLLSDVGETAKENNLYQQQSRAQNQLDLLEQEQGQLKEATRKVDTLSVFRYLDDARRLVDEHGS